jgi:hypothetical protein
MAAKTQQHLIVDQATGGRVIKVKSGLGVLNADHVDITSPDQKANLTLRGIQMQPDQFYSGGGALRRHLPRLTVPAFAHDFTQGT